MSSLHALLGSASTTPAQPGVSVVDAEKPGVPYATGAPPYNAPIPLLIDHVNTPDGSVVHDTNGTYIHPSVIDFYALTESGTFAGHRYWMVNSEYSYPFGQEDPMVTASDDAYEWRQPAGATPGTVWSITDQLPILPGSQNTDNEITYDPATGELVIIWREFSLAGETLERYWLSATTDGISWSAPLMLYQQAASSGSPCLVRLGDGAWVMFNWGRTAYRRTAPALRGPWSAWSVTNGARPWHAGVWRDPATGMLYCIGGSPGTGGGPALIAWTSTDDGVTWVQRKTVITTRVGSWDNEQLYRPTIQPHPDGEHFRIWYSKHQSAGAPHRTGYMVVPRNLWT